MTASESDRDAVGEPESSESGVPSEGAVLKDRFSSDEIFQRIIAAADEEITSNRRELFFSGVAAGLAISITFLLYASLTEATDGDPILSVLLYPIGFIYIIIGGYQLYTENTLPPVALTLERFASVTALVRNWGIVLAGNFAGGAFGAMVLAWGGVFSPEAALVAENIAEKGIKEAPLDLFFKGAFAGLIVAGVVWVEYAARDTISRLVVIYLAFLCIPLGNLFHVVVSFTEVVYLLLLGEAGVVVGLTEFVIPVLLGNTIGGVVLVTVVNYYQTSERRLGTMSEKGVQRLSSWEWVFGRYVGRAYVPLLEHHEHTAPRSGDEYRVLVPIKNPRTEENLVRLASVLGSEREEVTIHIVHMVQIPSNRGLQYTTEQRDRIKAESKEQLDPLVRSVEEFELDCETSTVVSYRTFQEIFNQAKRNQSDLVVMGWGEERNWSTLHAGRPIEELTSRLPCDFLVLKDRDLDTSRILFPTAGGPDANLGGEVASALQTELGSEVSLLHVVDGPDQREDGETFLANWSARHGLEDATTSIDDSGDIEAAIAREATDKTLLLLGATERGMLSRLASESLHLDVVNEVDSSVILAERPQERSLFERLFG